MRIRVFAAVIAIAGAGCVAPYGAEPGGPTAPAESGFSATAAPSTSAGLALTNVQFIRAGADLVLVSDEGMFLAGGGRLAVLASDLQPPAGGAAVTALDETHLFAAYAVDPNKVAVSRSSDGANTWEEMGQIEISAVDGVASLAMAASTDRLVVVANTARNVNFSYGVAAVSTDDGRTWKSEPLDVGGMVASAGGAFWLVGGVMGDEILVSTDGLQWKAASRPIASDTWTAGLPTSVDGLGVVLPVSSHGSSGEPSVTFWATTDLGSSWQALGSAPAPPTEADTTVPTSLLSDGHWVVVWADGSKVMTGSVDDIEAHTTISPNGLPTNVVSVAASGPGIAAVAMAASCPTGKTSCTSDAEVLWSSDMGQTWARIDRQ